MPTIAISLLQLLEYINLVSLAEIVGIEGDFLLFLAKFN